ncbi:MAG: hypothetical protein WD557_16165 [Dehalococcoidia bacterium]
MPPIRTDDGLLDGRPAAYFLTYAGYGTRLHGDQRGSVDKWHARPGTPFLEADAPRVAREREQMSFPPMHFKPLTVARSSSPFEK